MPAVPIDEHDLYERATHVLGEAVSGAELGPLVRLQGGASSITYRADCAGAASLPARVVLKVAPAGLEPKKNRDVLRQARLQRALQGTGVPCPQVLAEHPGSPPEVPPFYIMSFADGDCVEPSLLPESEALPPAEVRERELEAARILGLLHAIDPDAVGLADEPEVTPQEEFDRWNSSFEACDEDIRAGHEEVRDLLEARIPAVDQSSLIHGDFRLGNTLSTGSQVVSVIDWEIWGRSDPRVDLAWFLMMCNPDPDLGRRIADGMPSRAELLATYQDARGVEVKDLEWFDALVRYKQAAISALIARNARRRDENSPVGSGIPNMLRSARRMLESA